LGIQHWLSRLANAKALQYSDKLYVATDETNLTWFYPLTEAGYSIFFAKDFEIFRRIYESNPITGKDIIGFHEQVICSHAKFFIESYYSTFSWLIQRNRIAQSWNRKLFRHFRFSSVEWVNIDN
jgi:prephenate dehydrogenase